MGNSFFSKTGCFLLGVLFHTSMAQAAVIEYSLTPLGGDSWRYNYTLDNTNANTVFDEFTIYFDLPNVTAISSFSGPSGWDSLIVQPDPALPGSGFFDSLHTVGPVSAGSIISDFSVDFSYTHGLTPGAQRFDLVVSNPFQTVDSGITLSGVPESVPEPKTYALMLLGLCALTLASRIQPSKTTKSLRSDRGTTAQGHMGEAS